MDCLSPVDDGGKFTEEAGERFLGKDVLKEGNLEAINALEECGALIKVEVRICEKRSDEPRPQYLSE